jgi:hypothetical protein
VEEGAQIGAGALRRALPTRCRGEEQRDDPGSAAEIHRERA